MEKKVDESLEEKTTEEDVDDLESVNSSEALKSVRSMVMEAIAIVQVRNALAAKMKQWRQQQLRI